MNIIQRSAYRLLKQGIFAGPRYINHLQECCAIGVLLMHPELVGNGLLYPPAEDGFETDVQRQMHDCWPDLTPQDWKQLVELQRVHDIVERGTKVTIAQLINDAERIAGSTDKGQKELIQVAELLRAMECPFYYKAHETTCRFSRWHDAVFDNWQIHTHRTIRMSAQRAVEFMQRNNNTSGIQLKEIVA